MSRLLTRRNRSTWSAWRARGCVIAAASLEICRNVVCNVRVKLRRAVGNGRSFVDDGRQRFIGDINEVQCVPGCLACLGDNECDAFPDKTNRVDGHHRTVRHQSTGDDPVGLDVADFPDEVRTGESEAHAGGCARRREVYAGDPSMRMRRAQNRQIKGAGQVDVVYIASLPGEKLVILTPAERPADIGRRLHCFGHWVTRQKVST